MNDIILKTAIIKLASRIYRKPLTIRVYEDTILGTCAVMESGGRRFIQASVAGGPHNPRVLIEHIGVEILEDIAAIREHTNRDERALLAAMGQRRRPQEASERWKSSPLSGQR